ncbi:hypothetical protein C8R43DRAFT_1141768 [Mycena crocata]|nr:hypothetical protein C8R43DRAFT_1141768 [Mycena crocata]
MATRDQMFYKADGDCIFQAEDLLFKIPKYLFANSGSDLIQILKDVQVSGRGNSDTTPVVLNATSAQFRAFLFHAYDDPLQHILRLGSSDPSHLRSQVDLGFFCDIYRMARTKEFAIRIVAHICRRHRLTQQPPPHTLYIDMLKLAGLQPATMELMEDIQQIRTSVKTAWVGENPTLEMLQEALDAAERFHCSELLGHVYYLYLVQAEVDMAALAAPATPPCFSHPVHGSRLNRGSLSLRHTWRRLVTTVPTLERGPVGLCKCSPEEHRDYCIPEWKAAWRTAMHTVSDQVVDSGILEKLCMLHRILAPVYKTHTSRCGTDGGGIVPGLWKETTTNLANYFLTHS